MSAPSASSKGARLLVGSFAGTQLASWPVKVRYPGEENLAEGIPLAEMLHLRQGVRIYDPPSPERFDAANYGPLYYLLGSRLVNPQEPAYLPLRLVSLLGTLGCAAGCSLLALWLSRSYFAATLAPLPIILRRFVLAIHCSFAGSTATSPNGPRSTLCRSMR